MKRTRLQKLIEGFEHFRTMGLRVSFGIYDDEYELNIIDTELSEDGIYFTRRQIIDAIKNGGTLLIKETNKEGILNIEFLNRVIWFQRVSDDIVRVKLYKNELFELYELTKQCRNEQMDEVKNIQVPTE